VAWPKTTHWHVYDRNLSCWLIGKHPNLLPNSTPCTMQRTLCKLYLLPLLLCRPLCSDAPTAPHL
jgi:hypothetical protein